MADARNSDGGWPGGWLVSAVAGVIAAILARWIGQTGMTIAIVVGIFVFLVFGVLLGMFWAPPPAGDHGHGDHGHGDHDHGHGDHGYAAAPAPVPTVAPKVAEPVAAPAIISPPAPVASKVSEPPVVPEAPFPAIDPGHAPEPIAPPVAVVKTEAAPPSGVAVDNPAGVKPVGLAAARGGVADNLKTIEGIGPALEKLCNEMGVFHFDQIAAWGEAEVAWMDGNLKGFKGRVTRDKWVRQASLICEEGVEAFLVRAKTNDY